VMVLPATDPPPGRFTRGDTDRNGRVELSDVIRLFQSLFLGEPFVGCRDAYDMDDSGVLDLSDGISTLNFLFLGKTAPPMPFPAPGLDPTEDPLPPCEGT
jgi:hypothetical protein